MRPSYIWDARFLKVKINQETLEIERPTYLAQKRKNLRAAVNKLVAVLVAQNAEQFPG